MTEPTVDPALVLLLVGALTAAALWLKSGLEHLGLPALIGFLLLGLTVRCANAGLGLFGAGDLAIIKFLGQAGLVTLLFRVGLESNLRGLLKQLRSASLIWTADVALSGLLGYASAFYLLNLGLTSSLVVATAFTATSVGISVAVWQEMEAINSPAGELLIDIAELDDISAILLMALLFAVLPQLSAQGLSAATVPLIAGQVALFLLKFAGFGLLCFLFSLYVEKPISRYFRELESAPDPMLSIAALAFVIAALAERLGFSTAIGAFFAGLIFSRDPETVKMESSFMPIYDFFSPFFFITIGLQLDPAALMAALGPGLLLA
ncbi:MAG: cation:proton antiporter, partial [Desulfobacterales bacterium]